MTTAQPEHHLSRIEEPFPDSWVATCSCGKVFKAPREQYAVQKCKSHAFDANRTQCPTPRKTRYPSRVAAEREIVRIWRGMLGGPMLDVYRCRCQCWHLTNKERSKAPVRQEATP